MVKEINSLGLLILGNMKNIDVLIVNLQETSHGTFKVLKLNHIVKHFFGNRRALNSARFFAASGLSTGTRKG